MTHLTYTTINKTASKYIALGAIAGGGLGVGSSYFKQKGKDYAEGRERRVNPYRIVQSGLTGALVGAGAGYVAPRTLAMSKNLEDNFQRALTAMEGAASEGETLARKSYKNLDEMTANTAAIAQATGRIERATVPMMSTYGRLGNKLNNNRFFGIFSRGTP